MRRRLLALLATLGLALQASSALAALALEPHACACPMNGKDHHCGCAECARDRHQAEGCPSLGCCSHASPEVALAGQEPFFPRGDARTAAPVRPSPSFPALPAPPLAPSRDVPTPPPLG